MLAARIRKSSHVNLKSAGRVRAVGDNRPSGENAGLNSANRLGKNSEVRHSRSALARTALRPRRQSPTKIRNFPSGDESGRYIAAATGFPLNHQRVRSARIGRPPEQAEGAASVGIEDEMVSVAPQPGRIEFRGDVVGQPSQAPAGESTHSTRRLAQVSSRVSERDPSRSATSGNSDYRFDGARLKSARSFARQSPGNRPSTRFCGPLSETSKLSVSVSQLLRVFAENPPLEREPVRLWSSASRADGYRRRHQEGYRATAVR